VVIWSAKFADRTNLDCSHLQLSDVHARRLLPTACWIGLWVELTKRKDFRVYVKEGRHVDEEGGSARGNSASSGRRVRADHAVARLVTRNVSWGHGPWIFQANWGSKDVVALESSRV
jgi:hypothetical protein